MLLRGTYNGEIMKIKSFLIVLAFSFLLVACQAEPISLPGDILFEDDFSTGEHRWTSFANEGGVMGYDAGGFRFFIRDAGVNYWTTPGQNYNDARVDVDVLQYSGPLSNRMGLICRHQDDQNFYFFVISADGYYAIGKTKAGEQSLLGQEAMRYSDAIKKGVAINHLRADCHGNTLRFYINESLIAFVEDFDFTSGDVGLLAGTFEEGDLDLLFDDFVVMQP